MLKAISAPNEELLDSVRKMIDSRIPGKRRLLCRKFADIVLANIPPDDLDGITDKDLYGSIVSFFNFVEDKSQSSKLRVFNPGFEQHGWQSIHTVVETVNPDMPFIVDSIVGSLRNQRAVIHMLLHPIVAVRRNKDGKLIEIFSPEAKLPKDAVWESHIHIKTSQQPSQEKLTNLENNLSLCLQHVARVVDDFALMCERVNETADFPGVLTEKIGADNIRDARDFLLWVSSGKFVLTGTRDYVLTGKSNALRLEQVPGSALGVFRDAAYEVFRGFNDNVAPLPPDIVEFTRSPQLMMVNKANRSSLVHRPVHLDSIFVKIFDAKGKTRGLRLICGLYTASAYTGSAADIPLLRRKIKTVMDHSSVRPDTYDGRKLLNILESYPRDELFQIEIEELLKNVVGIAQLRGRERIALFIRRDAFGRFVTCLTYVPGESFTNNLRLRFQAAIGKAFSGEVVAHYPLSGDGSMARILFIVKTEPKTQPNEVDLKELERHLTSISRSWSDELRESLIVNYGEGAGLEFFDLYCSSFPGAYRETFSAQTASHDIARIRSVEDTGKLSIQIYKPLEAERESIHLKLISRGPPLPLSDVLPILENMGLRVIVEKPFMLKFGASRPPISIHECHMTLGHGEIIDLDTVRGLFEEALTKIWIGEVEQDPFNQLILRVGLHWREVVFLRAIARFLRQVGFPFTDAYISTVLGQNPEITRSLAALFRELHDPDRDRTAAMREADTITQHIEILLENVESLDEDRIFRRYINAILNILRCNFFQTDENGQPKNHLSFKFNSQNLDELPEPRPMVEIWVYSPSVEAVHLRGGKVARGGLRWSDRREDFRTEILGLIKAQMVKNAVIVPVGSKGGFIVKRPPPAGDREAFMAEGIRCYKTMIRGMLDITDNLVENSVVAPPRLVRHDADDPYLVVAADKGTATFSDIANGVSVEYGFWLGDAFASGGSAGYDHKKMGITARGAWESVKRHFLELGQDIQTSPFTVVGVGDMGGDVFGNGMLNSPHTRLIAAFNHMHVFIDPDPNAKTGFAERRRLFDLPRSTWLDYNAKLLSKGGGIFERKAKIITVSEQIRKLLDLPDTRISPNQLIRAILQAEVDLLWFGGIGTYVKATSESHAEAGDRANDAIRLNGKELRARVVGEGANLGLTQLGRIEFALQNGRINTDAVDNSAGVDCSDHEVNIKILLQGNIASGQMTGQQRDALLSEMTEEVGNLVLQDNYRQTQAISVTERKGFSLLAEQERYMRALERAGQLNRAIEFLPDEEAIGQRVAERIGLTRPELSVLLAYAKITLYEEILQSEFPDDPFLQTLLGNYFPSLLRQHHGAMIAQHRLRREITATILTNNLVNRLGATFAFTAQERTGRSPAEISSAFALSVEILDLSALWSEIDALDGNVPSSAQYDMLEQLQRAQKRFIYWLLSAHAPRLRTMQEGIERFKPNFRALGDCLLEIVAPTGRERIKERKNTLIESGAPEGLATRIAQLTYLAVGSNISELARNNQSSVAEVGQMFFAAGEIFGFDWLRREIESLPGESHWHALAVAAAIDDVSSNQVALTEQIIKGKNPKMQARLNDWTKRHQSRIQHVQETFADLRAQANIDFATLTVASRELRLLAQFQK